jgi:hypothetical protein
MKKISVLLFYLLGTTNSQLVLPLKNHHDSQLTVSLSISNKDSYKTIDLNVDTGSCDLVFQSHLCEACDAYNAKATVSYANLSGYLNRTKHEIGYAGSTVETEKVL